jgi:LmbE family N-acetylglucosaminyl deacetylase
VQAANRKKPIRWLAERNLLSTESDGALMAMTAAELLEASRRLPFCLLRDRLETSAIVILAPHPDDESLACGGLIAEARTEGRSVAVIFVSDGTGSHPNSTAYPPMRLKALREGEAKRACAELGVRAEDLLFLGLPDRSVPDSGVDAERAVSTIIERVDEVGARSLFVTWRHDPHCDHQASYQLAREVQKRRSGLRLFEYIVWGATLAPSTEVQPIKDGFRIYIGHIIEKKRRAIASHRSQTTGLIEDDPEGFRMTPIDLERFDLPYEFFLECDP